MAFNEMRPSLTNNMFAKSCCPTAKGERWIEMICKWDRSIEVEEVSLLSYAHFKDAAKRMTENKTIPAVVALLYFTDRVSSQVMALMVISRIARKNRTHATIQSCP